MIRPLLAINTEALGREFRRMKSDGTASPVRAGAQNGEQGGVAMSRHSAWNKKQAVGTGSGEPRLALAPVSPWTHTLVLSGELNHRSSRCP